MIHMGEPPYSVPATVWGVASAFPRVNIIIAHTAVQGNVLTLDAVNVARAHDNVYLETSWAQIHLLIEAVHTLGPERIIYGSDCAPQDMKKEIRLCEVLTMRPPLGMSLSADDLYKILGGNIARLCKIPLTEVETARAPVAAPAS
jgi:predicted TIM-barrel fold metal-dependent hydrolase